MATKIERSKTEAWRLLFKFKLQKLRWKFKQVFLLCLGSAMVYWAWMKLYLQGRDLYLLYWVVWIWLIPLTWWLLKKAIVNSWEKIDAVVYKIEYIESWSTYQRWTFIFARPKGGLLEGMGVIFKSERLSFSIPPEVLRPWDIITVYVSKWNSSNYWMDIKDAFYRIIES